MESADDAAQDAPGLGSSRNIKPRIMRDKILETLIKKEVSRQRETLDLIPSENIASPEVLKALGSPLVNKYSEGYPKKRYYAGNDIVDEIELLAQERARKVFCLGKNWHVNVQPYSGSPANMAVYLALLGAPMDADKNVDGRRSSIRENPRGNPRESADILGMSLPFGGHLTHGWKVNFSARFYRSVRYEVGRDGYIDYGEVRKIARRERPKIIVAGATAYPRTIDFKKFGAIAREIGAYFLADIAHIAGLIVAGAHPSPFSCADVVTTTTQKTLRGPRGAIIFANCKSPIAAKRKIDVAAAIDKAVFPGLQGGPHDNQTAAIAVALHEAAQPSFRKYGRQIVKNAKALAYELTRLGFELVSGGTDNHMMLIDLTNLGISGREAQDRLEANGIVVNRNTIPYDTRSPFDPSGIRIGTPSLTTRGMKEKEMREVAGFIREAIINNKNVHGQVLKLCRKFPLPY